MSDYLVISCSLNPSSNSRRLSKVAFEALQKSGVKVEWLDLREIDLPICDGSAAYGAPAVAPLVEKIRNAKCVLLGVPIYNYDVNAACKNMIELTGRAWSDKVVGFLCAAGGRMSYMSVMSLANSLMLDFRTFIIPRFVYADGGVFDEMGQHSPEIGERIEELVRAAMKLTSGLHSCNE